MSDRALDRLLGEATVPFDSIAIVEAAVRSWSDGLDSYAVRVCLTCGRPFETGSTEAGAAVQEYVRRCRAVVELARRI